VLLRDLILHFTQIKAAFSHIRIEILAGMRGIGRGCGGLGVGKESGEREEPCKHIKSKYFYSPVPNSIN
jgi:hypothetical protein